MRGYQIKDEESKNYLDEIGGMNNLKNWLKQKGELMKKLDEAVSFGVDTMKGCLITGMPGCGKTSIVKKFAKEYGLPLICINYDMLINDDKVGQEKILTNDHNMPAVLQIDEIERLFCDVKESEYEIYKRLDSLEFIFKLSKNNKIFIMATANDISIIPSRFLSKSWFDEVFYVGLPNEDEREEIFEVHIRKRRDMDFHEIRLKKIVEMTNGYSGIDIEKVVALAVEYAFLSCRGKLITDDLIQAIKNYKSVTDIMADYFVKMNMLYGKKKFNNASYLMQLKMSESKCDNDEADNAKVIDSNKDYKDGKILSV